MKIMQRNSYLIDFKYLILLLALFIGTSVAFADPIPYSGNDTLVSKEDDRRDLMKYLQGNWNVQGSWWVQEGKGKIKHTAKAKLSGQESFRPILNGHYLEKNMKAKVSYFSRDLDRSERVDFSNLAIMTYNDYTDKFYMWTYDTAGNFFESEGTFSMLEGKYSFETTTLDEEKNERYFLNTIAIIDKNHYEWTVYEKTRKKDEWSVKASGISKRK